MESNTICRGWKCGVFCNATITVASSPVWLDYYSSGTLRAIFLGSFGLNQAPSPLWAFFFPLFIYKPSVWIIISVCLLSAPLFLGRSAGFLWFSEGP